MNLSIPFEHGLVLAGILLLIGLVGVLLRRDAIFVLLSLEIMLNASGLAFVVSGARWNQADGQVMFLFILAVAAAEVSIGLALALWLYHWHKSVDIDRASSLKG
jgi:NADH-quinone oxidoreductase subunit K